MGPSLKQDNDFGGGMNPGELGVLIPIFGILLVGLTVFVKSDIGRAIAQRIGGGHPADSHLEEEVRQLRAEVDSLRGDLNEAQERIDFTERMLASGKKDG
jgi:hypothetical protein